MYLGNSGSTDPYILNSGAADKFQLNATGGSSAGLLAYYAPATLTGSGKVVLGGPGNYLGYYGEGYFINTAGHTIEGGGAIYAKVVNEGQITANNGVLTISAPITGSGNVGVADNATLQVNSTLQTGNFTMSRLAALNVASGYYLDLKGNYSFAQVDESKWTWGSLTMLQMSGGGLFQALEVGSEDLGAVLGGFSNNFDLVKLSLVGAGTYAYLNDAIDNENRHSPEALYADALWVDPDATLNLFGKHLYVLKDGLPYLVTIADDRASWLGGGHIIDESISVTPLPSTLLLLFSGLMGLWALGRRSRKT